MTDQGTFYGLYKGKPVFIGWPGGHLKYSDGSIVSDLDEDIIKNLNKIEIIKYQIQNPVKGEPPYPVGEGVYPLGDGVDMDYVMRTSSAEYHHRERDELIALLAGLYPASLERHVPEEDEWPDDQRWVIIIDLPTGQVSWHVPDWELPAFAHVPRLQGRIWDGHLDDVKYERIRRLHG